MRKSLQHIAGWELVYCKNNREKKIREAWWLWRFSKACLLVSKQEGTLPKNYVSTKDQIVEEKMY